MSRQWVGIYIYIYIYICTGTGMGTVGLNLTSMMDVVGMMNSFFIVMGAMGLLD